MDGLGCSFVPPGTAAPIVGSITSSIHRVSRRQYEQLESSESFGIYHDAAAAWMDYEPQRSVKAWLNESQLRRNES
jgi:hypothetical protein